MNNKNNDREERILNSLNGIRKATAPDFFYTRLTGRMQRETKPGKMTLFLLRPAFLTASLLIILVINIISLGSLGNQPEQQDTVKTYKPATIESFAEAYNLNTTTVYE